MDHRICVCLLKTDISLLFAWWQDAVCWLRGVTDDDVEFVSAAVAMSPWQQWCKYAAHKRCRRQQWCWWDAAKVIPNLHIFCLLASSPPTTDSLLASSPPTTDSLLATSPPTTDSLLATSPPTTDSLLASSPPTTDSLLATSPQQPTARFSSWLPLLQSTLLYYFVMFVVFL